MLSDFTRSLTAHSGSPSATLGWLYLLLAFSDWLLSPTVGGEQELLPGRMATDVSIRSLRLLVLSIHLHI